MSIQPTLEQVRGRVREQLAIVLSLPSESIGPESRILNDLNAESLDLLDLCFRLEEVFQVKVGQEDLAREFGQGVTPAEFGERFTVEGLARYVLGKMGESDGGG